MIEKALENPTASEHELGEIRAFIEQRSAILFDASRERFFSIRVREHMEAKKLPHGTELLRQIRSSNVEYDQLLERLLTQETSFFRYPDVYRALEKKVLPEIRVKKFWENPRTLRIWSAGCSTGEEPYSIAMAICDSIEFAEAWNINIMATDISRKALSFAERGLYPKREVEAIGLRADTYFTRVGDEYAIKPKLRNLISFTQMNLASPAYMGRFDVIFCMNVMIYFSEEKRAALIQRFYECLEPGGYLFVGHAESVAKLPVKFETNVHGDCLIYQKPGAGAARAAGVRE